MPSADLRRALERYADAWTRGDLAAISACYAEDFTLRYFGRHALAGEHVGKAKALQVLAEFGRRTGRRLLRVVDVATGPALGALVVREAMGPHATEVERVLVYTVEGGLLRTCAVFDQDQALIERLVGSA